MIVKVTQEHIDRGLVNFGKQGACKNCPIALALKDTFKVLYAFAGPQDLIIGLFPHDSIIFRISTPKVVYDWMRSYDVIDRFGVEPFEFELSLEGVKL